MDPLLLRRRKGGWRAGAAAGPGVRGRPAGGRGWAGPCRGLTDPQERRPSCGVSHRHRRPPRRSAGSGEVGEKGPGTVVPGGASRLSEGPRPRRRRGVGPGGRRGAPTGPVSHRVGPDAALPPRRPRATRRAWQLRFPTPRSGQGPEPRPIPPASRWRRSRPSTSQRALPVSGRWAPCGGGWRVEVPPLRRDPGPLLATGLRLVSVPATRDPRRTSTSSAAAAPEAEGVGLRLARDGARREPQSGRRARGGVRRAGGRARRDRGVSRRGETATRAGCAPGATLSRGGGGGAARAAAGARGNRLGRAGA